MLSTTLGPWNHHKCSETLPGCVLTAISQQQTNHEIQKSCIFLLLHI